MKTSFKAITSTILGLSLAFSAIIPVSAQQSLAVSCSANPSNPSTGQTVTWYAYPTGGNGNYTYTWTGSNALSGNNQTTYLTYYVAGQQNATVIVSSNGQTQTATCYVNVGGNNNNNGNLTASCYGNSNNGNTINWYVTPMGGNGSYSYYWTGTNGLSGYNQNVTQYYNYNGTQTANVTVTSNGSSYTATCTATTGNNYNNNNQLNAYCYASPSTVNPGQMVTWNGSASGGNGNYTYSWTGSNNMYGYNQIVTQTYSTGGTQTATLTVNSNGQVATANCVVNVTGGYYYNNGGTYYNNGGNYYNNNGQLSSGVYLNQVPYTGGGPNLKIDLFLLGLFLWSAFSAYMILERRKALNS